MFSANRASSAVDKDIRSFRDRYTMPSDARPSTTHAMRVSVAELVHRNFISLPNLLTKYILQESNNSIERITNFASVSTF